MNAKQPKKLMIMNILDILKKYTDENHRLSQKEIEDILKKEYNMKTDRKSIKRNLMNLIEFGYEIEYSESCRMVKNPKTGEMEESYMLSDFYLVRDFTDGELRLLIDGLLFSKHVPYSQCKELVDKLEGLSNIYFRSRVKHIATMQDNSTDNKQVFFNVEQIDEAISHKKKIAFRYLEYQTDKKMHPKKRYDGSEIYIVSPYQMAAKEGKYYLICNFDKYNDISNYRIDRMKDIEILDESVKPFETLQGANKMPLDLSKYMKSHVYMYSSDNCKAKLRIVKPMISDIIDMFGKDVSFSNEDENGVTVTVNANAMSIEHFAQSFAPDVVVLEPKHLAEKVKNRLQKAVEKYDN
ncbi:MAG: WYL domain-containing protein [Oscillospiraceae bacterium]|nr:WYL domain-containing protein [Candidatus Ruminococcus equi]